MPGTRMGVRGRQTAAQRRGEVTMYIGAGAVIIVLLIILLIILL
jgi:hypothetical protein